MKEARAHKIMLVSMISNKITINSHLAKYSQIKKTKSIYNICQNIKTVNDDLTFLVASVIQQSPYSGLLYLDKV